MVCKHLWFLAAALVVIGTAVGRAAERPNILWLTSEDNSAYLGCYGDPQAETPNLDRLAAQGVRYRNAFANAPVCSTARTTLITGMHATSLGVHHHRSRVAIPDAFLLYPEHLRAAGYYCTNNVKEDYNLVGEREIWDESSRTAHYRNRQPGQPFFAVFNSTASHESQVAAPPDKTEFRISPEDIRLPAHHPDTEALRRDWANYYDQMTKMDAQIGRWLDQLQREGLADDTIVFYFSDHGGALPGGKRSIHDVGTRVPLIIRFPEKWSHLAPAAAGQWDDSLVSFVDLPATVLSLAGVEVPDHYQGVPFLGAEQKKSQDTVFLFRGRMDERYDSVRAICDPRYRYVRNYSPHRPCGQHYSYAFRVQPSMRSWFAEYQAGRTDLRQSAYWKPKASEEFYDLEADPSESHNLADQGEDHEKLPAMRQRLREQIVATRDIGLIPEGMYPHLAGDQTIYDYAQSDAYEIDRVVTIADRATSRDAAHLESLREAMRDPHPVIRYWGATGCLILKGKSAAARGQLLDLLADDFNDVRVAAAEAVAHHGEADAALKCFTHVLKHGNAYEALAAQNAVEYLWVDKLISLDQARACMQARDQWSEPTNRIVEYLNGASDADRPRR